MFNLGVGGAMRVGFRYAAARGYRAMVQVDGDGQHDPHDLARLLEPLEDRPEPMLAIGARFAGRGHYDAPRARRWAMRLLASYLSWMTQVHLTDVTSGFRAHNRAAIELFARKYPADYLSDTVESVVLAIEAGGDRHPSPGLHAIAFGGIPESVDAARRRLPREGGLHAGSRRLSPSLSPSRNLGGTIMSGVHIIALISALATLSVIIELSRRRQLREKYAVVWLGVCVVVAFLAIAPGLFNRAAHAMGVISPPDLLTVLAALFLLVVCVYLSWELGRMEDKTRLLAEEVALLRNGLEELTPRAPEPGATDSGDDVQSGAALPRGTP